MLKLYTTDHCTLCERAFELLCAIPELAGSGLQTVDIAGDDRLLEMYGEQIPVLALNGRELSWPFDAQQVQAWLTAGAKS